MKTILLADDEKNIREFCRQELEDEGYRLILAAMAERRSIGPRRATRSGNPGSLHAKTRRLRCD